MKHIQKEKSPFIYVENSDFVSQTQDELKFSVENDFEEIVKLKDYGGRKNYSVYEFVTDLNGKFKVIEIINFEKIPVATYDKFGYVIAVENLDIDSEEKISLPDRIILNFKKSKNFQSARLLYAEFICSKKISRNATQTLKK